MLKPSQSLNCSNPLLQPPSGGCVLKLQQKTVNVRLLAQPPSGGCVLKQSGDQNKGYGAKPAAFRRLCVETLNVKLRVSIKAPAAFRRLCVETKQSYVYGIFGNIQPPSGGCVLKRLLYSLRTLNRLPAAFRRLCVETTGSVQPDRQRNPAAFRRLCVETIF